MFYALICIGNHVFSCLVSILSAIGYVSYGSLYYSFLLGFEVDKPSEILIKTLNAREYIESDIQNIEAPRIDDLII